MGFVIRYISTENHARRSRSAHRGAAAVDGLLPGASASNGVAMRARAAITDGRRASGGHGCIRRGHPGLLNAYCGRYLCRLVRAVSAYGTAAGAGGAKIWR